MKRALLGVIAIGLLTGCSTMSVNTDYSVDADFSQFKTFQYQNTDGNLEARSPLAHQRIVAAVRQQMTASGLTAVDGDPDVFVTYHGATDEQLQFSTMYTGVSGWGGPGWPRGMGITTSTTRATTITEGTLVIDVWDAEKNALVWRGVAQSTLSANPDRNTSKINRAVERAFRDFPPR